MIKGVGFNSSTMVKMQWFKIRGCLMFCCWIDVYRSLVDDAGNGVLYWGGDGELVSGF